MNVIKKFILYKLLENIDLDIKNQDINTQPSESQKESGNYKKGHIVWKGLNITIENPKGSKRSGVDKNGKNWESKLNNHYGYIKKTLGKDGDHVDVFLNNNIKNDDTDSDIIYIVNQTNDNDNFDEHKCMIGFVDKDSAEKAYLSNYEKGWNKYKNILPINVDDFKQWIKNDKSTKKEFKGIQNEK